MPRLVSLLGKETMQIIFGAGTEGFEELMEDPRVLAAIVANISSGLSEREQNKEDPMAVLKDILATTTAAPLDIGAEEPLQDGGSVYTHFDDHFAGEYMHLFKVVGWVANVNFMKPSRGRLSPRAMAAEAKLPAA